VILDGLIGRWTFRQMETVRSKEPKEAHVNTLVPIGAFVQVKGSSDGVGKLGDADAGIAEVHYFVSPAHPLELRRVANAQIETIELSAETRVYLFDEKRLVWHVGRVDGGLVSARALRASEDHYFVRFPNRKGANIPQSRLFVRWSYPIEDPTDYLAARTTETPYFFDGRTQIMRHLASERAAFGGLTALASASIELLEHQVTTVRRVLADPIERYLLADEVGLGKTIEAGILIRQHVIDNPDQARVLVIVPNHLLHQWRSELAEKFFLLDGGSVKVISEETLVSGDVASGKVTMLVVDEAHRPALRAFKIDPSERKVYECLRELAARVPRVLLLSGTPVLHQEDGFLAMLHLLDPDGYRLENRELFRRRVRDRQTIAEAIADLGDNASLLFVEEALARLEELYTDDTRLIELCRAVREHIDRDIENVDRIHSLRALRIHLTETYRLHRRLLRTRRDDPRVKDYLPRRPGVTRLDYEDSARGEAFDFLEAWRLALPSVGEGTRPTDHERLFAFLVESALSHPRVLMHKIDARLALSAGEAVSILAASERQLLASALAFKGEDILLKERRELIASALETEARCDCLVKWLLANHDTRKAVLFVDKSEIADLVAKKLLVALGEGTVIRHGFGYEAVDVFQRSEAIRVLVCDASAEEGLNLQRVGATVIHYDLPLESTRIEQRIGRVDRIEAKGRMRNVVFSSGCPYESEWLACLTDSVRVFNRSVAPLQYILAAATARIRDQLACEGPAAIESESIRMRDAQNGIEPELRRIRAQEALDSFEGDPELDRSFFEGLEEADNSAKDRGNLAFNAWVVERLRFIRREIGDNAFRYVHHLRHPTLVPLLEVIKRFLSCVDQDSGVRQSKYELPFRPATFDRVAAEKHGLELLRVGNGFVDAMEALIRADDRGAAFATWRHVPSFCEKEPRLFFRFDFIVEAELGPARSLLKSFNASPEALRRRADEAYPVEYRTIWLDSDLVEVSDPNLRVLLELPYTKRRRPDGGADLSLRFERWASVDAISPIGDWGDVCIRARRKAELLLRNGAEFKRRCDLYVKRQNERSVRVQDALRSRIACLSEPTRSSEKNLADFELHVAEALIAGMLSPNVRVDSAGVVFLSSTPLPVTEE
jgi:ATP-dependent helicase HepA